VTDPFAGQDEAEISLDRTLAFNGKILHRQRVIIRQASTLWCSVAWCSVAHATVALAGKEDFLPKSQTVPTALSRFEVSAEECLPGLMSFPCGEKDWCDVERILICENARARYDRFDRCAIRTNEEFLPR
jgi:hypothetical protein